VEADHIPDDFLLTLKVGEAWGKIGKTVFPFKTWLADQNPDPVRAKEVIERSRMNYGKPVTEASSNATFRFLEKPAQKTAVLPPQELPKDEESCLDPSQVF